jgi:DNA-binding transcriptional regulator YdaS (Cro superfamily)
MPSWLEALESACNASSQAAVARKLGVSAALVNQVLKGSYKGSLDGVKQRVEGALMSHTIECPILGEISTKDCLDYQRRPFAATNHERVRMYRACRQCPHNHQRRDEA